MRHGRGRLRRHNAAKRAVVDRNAAAREAVEAVPGLMSAVLGHLEQGEDLAAAGAVSRAWADAAREDRAWERASRKAPLLAELIELDGCALSWRGLYLQRMEAALRMRRARDDRYDVRGPRQDHEFFQIDSAYGKLPGRRKPSGTVATRAMVAKNDIFRRLPKHSKHTQLLRLAGKSAIVCDPEFGEKHLVYLKDVEDIELKEKHYTHTLVCLPLERLAPLPVLDTLHGRGQYMVSLEIVSAGGEVLFSAMSELAACEDLGLCKHAPDISWMSSDPVPTVTAWLIRKLDGAKFLCMRNSALEIEPDDTEIYAYAYSTLYCLANNKLGLLIPSFDLSADVSGKMVAQPRLDHQMYTRYEMCDNTELRMRGVHLSLEDPQHGECDDVSVDLLLQMLASPALAGFWVSPPLRQDTLLAVPDNVNQDDAKRQSTGLASELRHRIEKLGLLSRILQNLDAKELLRTSEVSRAWHDASNHDTAWALICGMPRLASLRLMKSMPECNATLKQLYMQHVTAEKADGQKSSGPDFSEYLLGIELFGGGGEPVLSALNELEPPTDALDQQYLFQQKLQPNELTIRVGERFRMEMTVFLVRKSDGKRFSLIERGHVNCHDAYTEMYDTNNSWLPTLGVRFPPADFASNCSRATRAWTNTSRATVAVRQLRSR